MGNKILFGGILAILMTIATIIVGKYLLSLLFVKLTSGKLCDVRLDNKKIFKYGVIADFITLIGITLFNALQQFDEYTPLSVGYIVQNFLVGLCETCVYPLYGNYFNDYSSHIIMAVGVMVSAVINFILIYFFICRKTHVKTVNKVIVPLLISILTAPYYFMISFSFLF